MNATPDSTLADPEQRIADLQRQLAECRAERDEALDQQTATAEVLGVINSSPGDLAPVFEAMLDKAMRLCSAAFGYLLTYDGERFQEVAHQGLPPRFAEYLPRMDQPGPSGAYARIKAGAPLVHVADLMEGEVYRSSPLRRALVDLGGARTGIVIALRKDETLLGVLTIYRQEVRPFSDKQIALLQNFAAQAVIAMENARLITETREALEQQTATAEVLGVINSSPGDLAPVFDAMLDKAIQLCGAKFGSLWTYDGDYFQVAAIRNVDPRFGEYMTREPWRPGPTTSHGRLLKGEHLVHVPDLTADEAYLAGEPMRRAAVELGGVRSLVNVALRKTDRVLGSIVFFREEAGPFSDKQIALLQNFAAQAVIAMENARLITETREALEQQTATAEVLQVINSSPGDLAPVFNAMLEKATRLCEAPFGVLRTWDGERFHLIAAQGDPKFTQWAWNYGPWAPDDDSSPAGRIVRGEEIVRFADAPGDEALRISPRFSALVEASGMRSGVTVALRKDDTLRGTVTVFRREVRPFTDKQIALLQNFAAQAVIAMENARLITETREALEQETATAEVLQVINSSPGDLAPVFDAILEKARKLCGTAFGSLELYEGGKFRSVAMHGLSGALVDHLRPPFEPLPGAPPARLIDGERIVQIADMAELAKQYPDDPRAQAAAEYGLRTVLFVPMRKGESLLGLISAGRKDVRPFTDKEIAVLQGFTAQAVIAMENARLLDELHQRSDEIAGWNRELEARVAEQVDELGRVGRLKRFLAPQLAELIVAQGDEKILESHRREIVVVFCDLRGYTAFTETAEPEEVLDFLREYHGALGPLVSQFEGTLDQFSGDGIMVFFNDPVPCPDPAERAVKMAMAMREEARNLIAAWRRHGCDLGFGAGIAQGYATLGQIGFSERSGYTAIGTVCNLAARLCAEAKDGQILVSSRVAGAVETVARLEDLGNLELKGLRRPVAAFNVTAPTEVPARL
jgi:GAF domain-containing protein